MLAKHAGQVRAASTHTHHSRQHTLASRLSDVRPCSPHVLHVRSRTRTRACYPRECSTTPEVLHTIPAGTTAMGGLAARMPKGSASEATSMDERPSPNTPRELYLPPGQEQVARHARVGRPGGVNTPARTCQSSRLLERGVFPNNLLTDLFSTHIHPCRCTASQDLPSLQLGFGSSRRAVLSRSPRIPSGTTRDL